MSGLHEKTLSIRWMIPFNRVTGTSPGDLGILKREGIGMKEFVDPDARIRHRVSMELLERAVERLADPQLGLKAGERVEAGDYDALEYAARSCANVREAILCVIRYQSLTHGGTEAELVEEGELGTWRWRPNDDVAQIPAANDFALVSACSLARRYMQTPGKLNEVHFLHAEPTSLSEYERIFETPTFRFSMPYNALVFARSTLDIPMAHAHAGLQAAYELHVSAALERIKRDEGVAGRVRAVLVEQLRAGDFSMERVARRMAMSVTTLRRRLSEEGTSQREILDELRRELARGYLADLKLGIREVAFLLGFAHVTAFYKAYHRWTGGTTPAEYRASLKRT
ncbi:MAG: Transcriptional regulator, AraC family [Myxococcaceae bacterium]|nr:Transcriptional regulator, AraC family [Myxococcaceae bacterium]